MSSLAPSSSLTMPEKDIKNESISTVQTNLCFDCQKLLSGMKDVVALNWKSDQSTAGWMYHLMPGSLQQSRQFCRLCKLLSDGWESSKINMVKLRSLDSLDDEFRSIVRIVVPDSSVKDTYRLSFKHRDLLFVDIHLIPDTTKIANMEGLSHLRTDRPSAGINTSSDTSLALVRSWIGNCLANHPRCNRVHSLRSLPTRLLEIGDKLLLRTSEGLPSDTLYTTLSHRWGTVETTRLTQSSYLEFSEVSIPLGDLPLKYQQAISYTKRLGIEYIWIDSLCIIQDSKEDWFKEADRMSDVYSNSHCNIAATAPGDGLFRDRDPASVSVCRVQPTWNGLDRGSFYCGLESDWTNEVTSAPLSKRGWVLQERALAPRVLHFGTYQLFWECRQSTASEMWPEGMAIQFRTRFNKEDMDFREVEDQGKEYFYVGWQNSVENYSRCQLTFTSDKLIAISGIARALHNLLGGKDTYLAGLWKNKLLIQLLWSISTSPSSATRVAPYRAPSWSWASLDTQVRWQGIRVNKATHLAHVLEATTVLARESPFGDVLGGTIRLRGPLFRVRISIAEDEPDRISLLAHPIGVPSGYLEMLIELDEKITRETSLDLDIHCILMVQFLPEATNAVDGLLLQPTKGRVIDGSERNCKGEFTRFGRFFGNGHDKWSKLVQGEPRISDPELQFEKDNRDRTYTITVI